MTDVPDQPVRITARPVMDELPAYRAGRAASDELYKLSSNENPHPPLPGVIDAAAAELARVNRYPDPGCGRLLDALAEHFDLSPDHFVAGTGSVAVLFSMLSAYCSAGDEVVFAWRSFEAYPIAVRLTDATPVMVPLAADGRHDLDAMADAITDRTKIVIVCTPNNPTGPAVSHDDLTAFLDRVPERVMVVIDEAYAEFVEQRSAARGFELAEQRRNAVVLRTFSKAYGLAGLRIGYAIAPIHVAQTIRKAVPPFSVTDIAQAAAVASLRSRDELQARVAAVVGERTRVVDALRAQGWRLPDSQGNFVWLALGDDSVGFAEACAPLTVRAFDGEGVRVSIGSPEANDRLLDLAARWLTDH